MPATLFQTITCPFVLVCLSAVRAQQLPYEVVMRSSAPGAAWMDVLYSSDENYAAVAFNGTAYVYDLRLKAEVLRTKVLDLPFPFHNGSAAFDSTSKRFYVSRGSDIQECILGSDSGCSTIRTDIRMNFAVGESRRVAFVTADHRPAVAPTTPANSKPALFAETVPAADLEDFAWLYIGLPSHPGRNPQLVLTGNIPRDTRVLGENGRTRTITRSELRASAFDIVTGDITANYAKIPLIVHQSMMTAEGHVLFCGIDQAEEEAIEEAGKSTQFPTRFYDLFAERYLSGTELARVPKEFRARCTTPLNNFAPLTPPQPVAPGQISLNPGWQSPSGKQLIGSANTVRGIGQLLYLKHLTAPFTTDVLGGSTDSVQHLRIFPPARLVANGVSSYIFDFATGLVNYLPWNVSYASEGGAFFIPEGSLREWNLYYLKRDNSIVKGELSLKTIPEWYVLSPDGGVLVYKTRAGLFRFSGGVSTTVKCNHSWLSSPPPVPVIDSTGTLIGAFCVGVNEDLDLEPQFVVWNLSTGEPVLHVAAEGYENAAAFTWEAGKVVLAGSAGLRIATLDQARLTDFPLPKDVGGTSQISGLTLQGTPPVAIVAANDVVNDRSTLMWTDLSTGQTIDRVDSPGRVGDLVAFPYGTVGVVRSDNVLSVYSSEHKRILQIFETGFGDWVAFSEEGMFDGTAGGLQWAGFRRSKNSPVLTANLFFNELYAPGLLNRLVTTAAPKLPAGVGLDTYLDLPGLKLLLQSGDLTPQLRNGTALVCVARQEVFDTLRARGLITELDRDSVCPRRVVLSDKSDATSLVAGLNSLAQSGSATPWDNLTISGRPKSIHLLSVAIGKYGRSELPDIPSAVPASRALEKAIMARSVGNVIDWAARDCGGPLEDQKATRSAISACLAKMIPSVTPDDMVIVNLAGHGGTAGEGEMFYFYTYSDGQDIEQISAAELADVFRRLPARRIVLIVDACNSGAALGTLQQAVAAKVAIGAGLRVRTAAEGFAQDAEGVLLLAATSGLEPALSTTTANPFLDKLTKLFESVGTEVLSSHALANEMRKPLETGGGSGTLSSRPLAFALGADFAIGVPAGK